MKKMQTLITVIAVIALVGIGFLAAQLLDKEPKVTVSATSISEQLSACSELAAAQLDYRGIINYTEGSIPLFDKKAFSMIYDATVKAGIDLSKADVQVSGDTITIGIPAAQVLSIEIDSDHLEFYDEQFALFNWTDKTDTTNALAYAKEDAAAKVDQTELIAQASEHTRTLIEALLTPLKTSGGSSYKIVFTEV